MIDEDFRKIIKKMLKNINVACDFVVTPLKGGRNNKVFKLKTNDNFFLIKKYFYHPDDTRDRLCHEYRFLDYACEYETLPVPRPITFDQDNRVGIYQFVHGQSFKKGDLSNSIIQQALDFYILLNKNKDKPKAHRVPIAVEACLSISDFINSTQWRIDKLKNIQCMLEVDQDALSFVKHEIIEVWHTIKNRIITFCKVNEIHINDSISQNQLCISPSDFGFHNALLTSDNKVIFLDFEYAGWDDPAKMLCDFFLQPNVPVSRDYFDLFLRTIYQKGNLNFHKERIHFLFPLFQVKWCCLLLNEFLPVAIERRKFAALEYDYEEQKKIQLAKSKNMFNSISL